MTLNAGQVVDLGVVSTSFEIAGDHEFAVSAFELGGDLQDPVANRGGSSQTQVIAVEQFRDTYVFAAPLPIDQVNEASFVNIIQPASATLTLDGKPVDAFAWAVGSSSYAVRRVKLGPGKNGAHVLHASAPVGIQVETWGLSAGHQYPGGLKLDAIASMPAQ
jgi:hypothetical protein